MATPPEHWSDLPPLQFPDRPPFEPAVALRGHVVVVVAGRLGCGHCRQALRTLAQLAATFGGRACAAVAVHAAVDPAEREPGRWSRELAALPGPVLAAVDPEHQWVRRCGALALPFVVLFDVDGRLVQAAAGEPRPAALAAAVEALLGRAERAGTTARVPCLPVRAAPVFAPVALMGTPDGLWLAFACRAVVVELAPDGSRRAVHPLPPGVVPSGVCAAGGQLYVTDVAGHRLWGRERGQGSWTVVCGKGERGTDRRGGGFGEAQALSSPTAPVLVDGAVVFANGGTHQVWQCAPDTGMAAAWFGTGNRGLVDGDERAEFAEPRALAATPTHLWVADAGLGALRAIELAHGFVRTVTTGLRQPVAVAVDEDTVFVAEAFGAAVQRVVGSTGAVPWLGRHLGLIEPIGLAVVGGRLWIADAGRGELLAVPLAGVAAAAEPALRVAFAALLQDIAPPVWRVAAVAEPLRVGAFADVRLRVPLPLAPGDQLETSAPVEVDVVDEAEPTLVVDRHVLADFADAVPVVLLPFGAPGQGALRVRVVATVRDAAGTPWRRRFDFVVAVEVADAGPVEVSLAVPAGS